VQTELAVLHNASTVVDFGCGHGALLQVLRGSSFRGEYLGVDIDRIAIQALSEQNDDSRSSYASPDRIPGRIDLAFVCNVLVYNDDASSIRILESLRRGAGPGCCLLVLEPFPAWYWEFVFDGLRLHPRRPSTLDLLLRRSGWSIHRSATVSLISAFGIGICPIAYCLAATVAP
jgi:SAM-dependent methyltransferase